MLPAFLLAQPEPEGECSRDEACGSNANCICGENVLPDSRARLSCDVSTCVLKFKLRPFGAEIHAYVNRKHVNYFRGFLVDVAGTIWHSCLCCPLGDFGAVVALCERSVTYCT